MVYYKKWILVLGLFSTLLYGCGKEEKASLDKDIALKKPSVKESIKNQEIPVEIKPVTPHEEVSQPLQKEEPKKRMLSLSINVQENSYYCGPAVVQTILQYNNIDKTQKELAQELQTSSKTGSEYVDIARVLNTNIFHNENPTIYEDGYHVQTLALQEQDQALKQQFMDRMRTNIEHGYPSVIAIDLHTLYPQLTAANHVIICNGYQTKAASDVIEYFYIEDPYYGVQDETNGGLKIVTVDELWNALIYGEEPAYIY